MKFMCRCAYCDAILRGNLPSGETEIVATGKPLKEREHNTGKPGKCQEPETASKHGIKDTVLAGLRRGDLNDDLFYMLRYALMRKSLLKKGEKLLPALERLDMDEEWYRMVWDEWGDLEAKA